MADGQRSDIAIYAPYARTFYRREGAPGADRRLGGGGAEMQTFLAAEALRATGLRVAHIVFPVEDPAPEEAGSGRYVERPRLPAPGPAYRLAEARNIWLAMRKADARVYVIRGSGSQLPVAALFCAVHRSALVFSASNDLDFDLPRLIPSRIGRRVYLGALRSCRHLIVQTKQQEALARELVGPEHEISQIRNFAEPPLPDEAAEPADGFVWVGRLVDYKLPMRYLALARELPEVKFRMVTSQTLATPPEFEAEVRAEAERLSNVEFFELLPRREVLGFIRRSAAVVLTSRAEGMPNVLLESWARGVPALSLHFDPDGVIARHGLGLAAGGSWDDFVEGARRLWADSELRRTLGQQAKGYVEREHSPAAVGARWVEVLGGVLGGPAHSDRGPPGARAADRLPEDAAAD